MKSIKLRKENLGKEKTRVRKMKVTSAYANKILKELEEEKEYWRKKESISHTYTAAIGEEPFIPEYDYVEVAKNIADIDEKICKIKHAINLSNVNVPILVGEKKMSVDTILVSMAQLNKRKLILDNMRKKMPKMRTDSLSFSAGESGPEYVYINYDLDVVKEDYKTVSREIMQMQIALDKHNQTYEFEIDI